MACIVCPIIILYFIYAYCKERKADAQADEAKTKFMDGGYFKSPEWHEKYVIYLNENPVEKPKYQSMKIDLLKRFQRREYLVGMILPLFLMICIVCLIPMRRYFMAVIGICLFGFLFWLQFSLYIGMPVRKWIKGDIDYPVLESSYLKSQMLLYKTNGLAFGTTQIHVRLPKSGMIHDVEIELNEFQVQMAIDKLSTYKLGEELHETISVNEHKENETVA